MEPPDVERADDCAGVFILDFRVDDRSLLPGRTANDSVPLIFFINSHSLLF
jgi:hypothetical protein